MNRQKLEIALNLTNCKVERNQEYVEILRRIWILPNFKKFSSVQRGEELLPDGSNFLGLRRTGICMSQCLSDVYETSRAVTDSWVI
jgi:hypothetical protein